MVDPTGNDDSGIEGLRARVAALEAEVARLSQLVAPDRESAGQAVSPPPAPRATADDAATSRAPARPTADDLFAVRGPAGVPPAASRRSAASADPGQWVGRLGTLLLLLGVAFAFQYSIDRGWLGPAVRVAAGLGLSAVLQVLGSRLRTSRPGLSRLLAGGGVVSGYLSVYAGFQMYSLWPAPLAFLAMSAVTASAFVLGLKDDEAAAVTLGAAGGLATPFLLYTGEPTWVPGLVAHTSVVSAGAAAVFARRGWRELAWTLAIGGWAATAVAAGSASGAGEATVVTAGAALLALVSWWLPVVREVLVETSPALWRPTRDGLGSSWTGSQADGTAMPRLLSVLVPLALLTTTHVAWDLSDTARGWSALALAAFTAALAVPLRARGTSGQALAAGQWVSAAVLVAFAVVKLAGPETRPAFLAAEALAMHVLASTSARRGGAASGDRPARLLGDLLFAASAFWSLGRILDDIDLRAWSFGLAEVADLFVVAALGAAGLVRERGAGGRLGDDGARYAVAAQAGLLLWLMDVLQGLPNGEAWVTAAWFADAVVLVVAGLRFDFATLRRGGALVMAATMAKLFLFDLDDVDAGWRIVVFLGFGVVLLGLGYAFPALLGRGSAQRAGADTGPTAR